MNKYFFQISEWTLLSLIVGGFLVLGLVAAVVTIDYVRGIMR